MQKGVSMCMRQNEYSFPKAAISTSFEAIWYYLACVLVLNAVRFGAKRKVKCC